MTPNRFVAILENTHYLTILLCLLERLGFSCSGGPWLFWRWRDVWFLRFGELTETTIENNPKTNTFETFLALADPGRFEGDRVCDFWGFGSSPKPQWKTNPKPRLLKLFWLWQTWQFLRCVSAAHDTQKPNKTLVFWRHDSKKPYKTFGFWRRHSKKT